MEKREQSHEKHADAVAACGKRKRNPMSFYSLQLEQAKADTIFALLLAALSNLQKPKSRFLIKKCLSKIRACLLSEASVRPILALVPALLNSKCSEIACRSADIVGAASLTSFEMNEEIASDSETLKATAAEIFCPRETDIPEFSKSVFLCFEGRGNINCIKIGIKEEDEASVALLSSIIVLINACDIAQLQNIPRSLSEAFLTVLQELWANGNNQMAVGAAKKSNVAESFCKSNIGISDLAESIFRLSINVCQCNVDLPFEVIKRSLFGTGKSSFEEFISNHWELSPFLLARTSKNLNEDDIFSSFRKTLSWTGSMPSFLSSVLLGLVSCFPIASDEQDILNFLNEVKGRLGCPIIYQQDIRVVKTEKHLGEEVHYFQDFYPGCSKEPLYFMIEDVLKCGQAYEQGYTIALRGLEFRYQSIAAIADTLAFMFGQPSIFGCKQWTVFSRCSQLLPCLYDDLHDSDFDYATTASKEFLLREGDVLYIPRGFPHEAHTNSNGDDGSSGFSLHLTLSVEVEPPFEWEGVAHFALHCWSEDQKWPCFDGLTPLSQKLELVSVILLHVAIGILSNSDPIFRKACLAAAHFLPPDICDWLSKSQRNIFCHIIDKIHTESRFLEVLNSIEVAVQKNEDPFQQIRWLWLLNLKKEISRGCDPNQPFLIEDLPSYCAQHKDKVEAAFLDMKSRFCSEVVFGDVIASYGTLLEKYRKTRKQYINGMISLHDKL
ncbi:hypothetical protein L6164_013980 [Bauhinia variegata]|uniref:Uncharacterized protein n=1 Tax=Bauhinia variegata TaxID=167791 RepID=A0ACB9NGU5_BAUVA|nr:hypothetical protein L6164_013980 [Bauhinia variegata]